MSGCVWKGRSIETIETAAAMKRDGKSLREIGLYLGVCRERARHILAKYNRCRRLGVPMRGEQ